MARSRYKAGGATAGRFKPKKMNKGWSTNRKTPIGSRPVLRITPVEDEADKPAEKPAEAETKTEE